MRCHKSNQNYFFYSIEETLFSLTLVLVCLRKILKYMFIAGVWCGVVCCGVVCRVVLWFYAMGTYRDTTAG